MGHPIALDKITLQPEVIVEPFKKWELDFIGAINPLLKKKRYILLCIDYVTKCVEEKDLTKQIE